jgi:tripartite-type tricarboxylate transporter receptor subunit TctC
METTMKKWITTAFGLIACTVALAQGLGGTPLVLVVGGPSGNPGDLLLRILSEPLAAELGQPVVVDNKPGAAGTIGLAAVARARPDGNVLGLLALQSAVAPALIQSVPYDTLRDLLPVRQLSWVSNVLVIKADSPFNSLESVISAARSGPLTFASGGNGTPAHLAAALFAQEARIQVQHVPFNGAMGGVNALVGGHVQLMFATVPSVAGLLQSGKLRAVAASSPERLRVAPAVPTLAESGLAGASMRDWHGLVAPAGTPPERIRRIAAALDKVLAAEAVRQRLAAAGLEPVVKSTPDEFRSLVAGEVIRWGDLVRHAGIKLQ